MSPYATVVIPTHERAATLDVAVGSVQSQTVTNIEILIVCDGATEDVRALARGLAGSDPRVRVLDLPKAPGPGGANRDRAVRDEAASERIFYTDDDDLWLREHVERIGPHLDSHDVVDTLPVAATGCGRLALAPVNSGAPAARRLLVEDRLKLMYDTHLAHRRSTYLKLGSPWTLSTGGDVVRRLFATFAADPGVAWLTLPMPTAISLHGGARAAYSPAERRLEILEWRNRVGGWPSDRLASASSLVWQLFSCLTLHPAAPDDDLQAYLGRLGLRLPGPPGEELCLPLTREASSDAAVAFDLQGRRPVATADLSRVAPLLLDNVKHATASWAYLRRALSRLPLARARRLVADFPRENARADEFTAIFEVYQYLWARQLDAAWTAAEPLLETVRTAPHEIELVAGDVLLALGRRDDGLHLLRRAVGRADRGSAIGLRLVQALIKEGRLDEASERLAEAERRIGGMKQVGQLRAEIDGALAVSRRSDGSAGPAGG